MSLPVITAIVVFLSIANLVTATLFVWDKRAANRDQWRVSEQTLLTWSALGGWPAGLICGRMIRHKTSKKSFRWKFSVAVAVNLIAIATAAWLAVAIGT
jgi:uncharacterized membrane protein YsdA (DUF1294 family)